MSKLRIGMFSAVLLTGTTLNFQMGYGLDSKAPEGWTDGVQFFDGAEPKSGVVFVRAENPNNRTVESREVISREIISQTPKQKQGVDQTQPFQRKAGQNQFSTAIETQVNWVWTETWRETWREEGYDTVDHWKTVCEKVPGNGKGDWHGFYGEFSGVSGNRPEQLAAAVKGIGNSTAECLVEKGLLRDKPDDWDAFKARMRQAENACGKQIYDNVIEKYGGENAQKLGYSKQEVCEQKNFPRNVPYVDDWREVKPEPKSELANNAKRAFNIIVQGAPLLPSEEETITAEFDGLSADVRADSRYNNYTKTVKGNQYTLTGRRLLATPNNSLKMQIRNAGANQVLSITDHDYIKGLDNPQAQTSAVISVIKKITTTKEVGWWPFKRTVTEETTKLAAQDTIPLKNGQAEKSFSDIAKFSVAPRDKFFVEFEVQRTNSKFNNNTTSPKQTTPDYTR
ncbi:MAG: hypothetical protein A3G41_06505 [Elusimicrobia bacterium RIFCSPLOWO2_12_FULL_59_9]|nr:MAG: hypothetical protein A3G41_06505 [Elusimicrobia bacterium RIFCSPLOWO2_12_FULL_59_9]